MKALQSACLLQYYDGSSDVTYRGRKLLDHQDRWTGFASEKVRLSRDGPRKRYASGKISLKLDIALESYASKETYLREMCTKRDVPLGIECFWKL